MSEAKLLEILKEMLLNIQERRYIATDDVEWEDFKVKVHNHIRYSRRKNENQLRSVQDIISKCKEHEIIIPQGYVP
jgi:hypothetical protein